MIQTGFKGSVVLIFRYHFLSIRSISALEVHQLRSDDSITTIDRNKDTLWDAYSLLCTFTFQVTKYVKSLFPDSSVLSNNGGLMTYRVPGGSIKVEGPWTRMLQSDNSSLIITPQTQLSDNFYAFS